MIKPSIGRIVWYQPPCAPGQPFRDQPFAGQVAYVWNDRLINIGYLDQNGTAYSATSVTLLQDDDVPPVTGNFAQWMPYQTERAAKDLAEITPASDPGPAKKRKVVASTDESVGETLPND